MKMKPFHVGIAAEAFAAGLFAQAGCDVLVQYGANQPHYDLMVTRGQRSIKVSVKGSQDGGWGLVQGYKKKGVDYHEAIDAWAATHSRGIVFCFVQFNGVSLGQCPRVYLALVSEVATYLKKTRNATGDTILWERHTYARGVGANTTNEIPPQWIFSLEKVNALLREDI